MPTILANIKYSRLFHAKCQYCMFIVLPALKV